MIVIPYVRDRLEDATRTWAIMKGGILFDVGGSDSSYWCLLREQWTVNDDLVVIEQDILPTPMVVEDMLSCSEPWCTSPYVVSGRLYLDCGLGCTKFSADLKLMLPNAVEDVAHPYGDNEPERAWWTLDGRFNHVLRREGLKPHVHRESVHLH